MRSKEWWKREIGFLPNQWIKEQKENTFSFSCHTDVSHFPLIYSSVCALMLCVYVWCVVIHWSISMNLENRNALRLSIRFAQHLRRFKRVRMVSVHLSSQFGSVQNSRRWILFFHIFFCISINLPFEHLPILIHTRPVRQAKWPRDVNFIAYSRRIITKMIASEDFLFRFVNKPINKCALILLDGI